MSGSQLSKLWYMISRACTAMKYSPLLLYLASMSVVSCLDQDYSSCYMSGITWNTEHSINLVLNITSVDDCVDICRKNYYCKYLTWHDHTHPYIPLSCAVFTTVPPEVEAECYSCTSAILSCVCSSPTACLATKDNILYAYTGVEKEAQCEYYCNENHACNNYTWFAKGHPNTHLCILYTHCPNVDDTCWGCCSGTRTADSWCSPLRHKELSSSERSILAGAGKNKDIKYDRNSSMENVAPDWDGEGWYRFTGEAGNKMAEEFPGWNKCTTESPGYLHVCQDDESCMLPTVAEGKKQMTLCFGTKWSSACFNKEEVSVMNCGEFFLYYLKNMKIYNGSVCGQPN